MHLSKKLVIRLFANKKKNQDFDFKNVQSILIRPIGDAVGDAVAHINYARQLKKAYPNCRIGMFTTDRNRDVFKCCEEIDELLEDKPASYLKNRKKWQVLLDFYASFTSMHIIGDSLLAPELIMVFEKQAKKYYSLNNVLNYDFHCPPPPENHIADRLLTSEFTRHIPLEKSKFHLEIPNYELTKAISLWPGDAKQKIRILLAPQGSDPKRCIPEEDLAELLNNCSPELLSQAEFVLCNSKFSEAYFAQLKQLCSPDISLSLAPKTSLKEYLALTASADIAICVDSGTVHLACAFNRPLLAFYANLPKNLKMWHPLPNQGVPFLMVTAKTEKTHNFPLHEAKGWLNQQIKNCLQQQKASA